MKAVILAGGYGTRISEETDNKPKPMVEIGSMPLLWHIMKLYSFYGINEFIICCGYKGYLIKEYFSNYFLHRSDVTIDLGENAIEVHKKSSEPWKVTLIDTGQDTMTGGRLKRISSYVEKEDCFCMTYGDGLSDINISHLIEFHKSKGLHATLTATHLPGRFGIIDIPRGVVQSFKEKPKKSEGWINGGFFVLSPNVLNLIKGDETVWEREPLEKLADSGQLSAFKHGGFFQPMDSLRDRVFLESLWKSGDAPWKIW